MLQSLIDFTIPGSTCSLFYKQDKTILAKYY